MTRRANVLGLGLIGGSVAAGLRASGWHVSGSDAGSGREAEALSRGIIDSCGVDATAEISFVATPVSQVIDGVQAMLRSTAGVVTDVGSVKLP
ncbi:MAG: prephenate dehydrogenase/arogenate dehydrogenase family protein, partial [Ilumatobacteraceae bacterium]|nr:prephenate dehydrogenase/arogenate dehydrogenase family protein [Ilumatobacteraceae bacterium]